MDKFDEELRILQEKLNALNNLKHEEIKRIEEVKVENIQEPSLKDTVRELNSILKGDKKDKSVSKKLKILRRAKVGKSKMKKGWSGLFFLNENKTISGEKVKLEGGTYRTKDGNIHVTDGNELIFWEAKYPVLFQRYDKLNPTNLLAKPGEKNEIYGQEMVELRMKRDLIKEKSGMKMGWVMIIIVLVGGYFLIKAFFPKLFGG